ncbi:MAG: hypothetical protein GDA56_17365 [Hormoscilla sp. GM7CHS1pb]|nr:hypothetical protein [Hormoscilla sp. GM7CHS1pb]
MIFAIAYHNLWVQQIDNGQAGPDRRDRTGGTPVLRMITGSQDPGND